MTMQITSERAKIEGRKQADALSKSTVERELTSLATAEPVAADNPQPNMTPQPWVPLFGWNVRLPMGMRALRHRNFRLFWTGQLVSLVGTWMQMVARGWLVLELTHSPFWLGMVGFANSVPVLLLSLWAGAIADSVSKRRLVIVTQVVSMVMAFILAALTFTNTVEVWHILAVSVVLGTAFAFDGPTRQAFTVEMVNGKEDLMNAVALNSAIFNGARVLGPAIGAVALALQGPGLAFLLNGLSYLAVLYGLFKMDVREPKKKADSKSGKQILDGLRFVAGDKIIGPLMIIVSVVSVFAFPYVVLLPIFADTILHVGETGYGTLMAFSGIGSLIGAVGLAFQSGRSTVKRGRLVLIGSIGLPIFLAIFSLSPNYLLSLAMLVGIGWTMIAVNATINTVVQTNVPDELRGRVNGVFAFLFIGMAPFGNLQAGLIADHFGAPMALLVGAVTSLVVIAFVLLKNRQIMSLA
ncbi:MAG TPA: MFS transporter [Chloroflexia bacterium]|jgi:MFS family permease